MAVERYLPSVLPNQDHKFYSVWNPIEAAFCHKFAKQRIWREMEIEAREREREDLSAKARSWLLPAVSLQKQRTCWANEREATEKGHCCKSRVVAASWSDLQKHRWWETERQMTLLQKRDCEKETGEREQNLVFVFLLFSFI